jgi:TolB-like protein
VEAVRSSLEIQEQAIAAEGGQTEPDRIRYRVGIHLGDVIVDGDDIQGHGVNVAARLEGLAEPGGVCVSETVRNALGSSLRLVFKDLGPQEVKNIAEPVRAYRITGTTEELAATARRIPDKRFLLWGLAGLAILIAVILPYSLGFKGLRPSEGQPVAPAIAVKPGIAVLPFLNMSDEKDQEFFVDGLTEDLIIDLSKLSGLFVISRNSSFAYKGQTVRPQLIAKELGITHVLNGSVRRAGDQVRITAELVDAANDRQIWSGRYDRKLTDIFGVQDEVKKEIIAALEVQLTPGEKTEVAAAAPPTKNIEAYEYYLRGRYAMNLGTRRALRLAYFSFEKAVSLDSEFAEALAGLAMTYATDLTGTNNSWFDWVRSPARARPQAEVLARKAQALNASLAGPDLVLARLALAEWRFDDAIGYARRAVDLDPGNAETHAMLARALTANGQHQSARTEIDEALRRDPKPSLSTLEIQGIVLFGLRDYARASQVFDQYYQKAVDGGGWIASTFDTATDFYAGNQRDIRTAIAGGFWDQGIAVTRFNRFYREDSDMAHLVDGLRGANMPEFPSEFDPVKQQAQPVTGPALTALLSGGWFETLCWAPRLNGEFRFAQGQQMVWTLRQDLTDIGKAQIHSDQVCVRFPTLTRNREACYSVFKVKGDNNLTREYPYALAGPSLCYFREKK